jgi:hypothetical protein
MGRKTGKAKRTIKKKVLKAAKKAVLPTDAKGAVIGKKLNKSVVAARIRSQGATSDAATAASTATHRFAVRVRADFSGSKAGAVQKMSKQEKEELLESLKKQRATLRKEHQKQNMVMKKHIETLRQRKNSMRRGENVKKERQQMSKYIRDIMAEHEQKQRDELNAIQKQIDEICPSELTGKERRQLTALRGMTSQFNGEGADGDQVGAEEDGEGLEGDEAPGQEDEGWVDVVEPPVSQAALRNMFSSLQP